MTMEIGKIQIPVEIDVCARINGERLVLATGGTHLDLQIKTGRGGGRGYTGGGVINTGVTVDTAQMGEQLASALRGVTVRGSDDAQHSDA